MNSKSSASLFRSGYFYFQEMSFMLRQYNPSIKRVLFLCYNITLVNYIKRLLAEKGVGLGEGGVEVEVYHFYQLCSEIPGEKVLYESEDSDYYSLVVQETLSKLKG